MADQLLLHIFGHTEGAAQLEWEEDDDDDEEEPAQEAAAEEGDASEGGAGAASPHELELDAPPEEVIRRIQSATLWFICQLAEGVLPEIELVSRAASNRTLTAAGGSGDGADEEDGGAEEGASGPYVLRMQHAMQRRSLLGRHPESAEAVARLWVLLDAVHGMLLAGQQATQRELWYRFKTLEASGCWAYCCTQLLPSWFFHQAHNCSQGAA